MKQGQAEVQNREFSGDDVEEPDLADRSMENLVLPLLFHRNEKMIPVDDQKK